MAPQPMACGWWIGSQVWKVVTRTRLWGYGVPYRPVTELGESTNRSGSGTASSPEAAAATNQKATARTSSEVGILKMKTDGLSPWVRYQKCRVAV